MHFQTSKIWLASYSEKTVNGPTTHKLISVQHRRCLIPIHTLRTAILRHILPSLTLHGLIVAVITTHRNRIRSDTKRPVVIVTQRSHAERSTHLSVRIGHCTHGTITASATTHPTKRVHFVQRKLGRSLILDKYQICVLSYALVSPCELDRVQPVDSVTF
jgi:hypothetical protein